MELRHLYRLWWAPDTFEGIAFEEGQSEGRYYVTVHDGRIAGRISGRFRGSNHASRRGDGTFESCVHGAIETHDGATIVFNIAGYSYELPEGHRGVGWATHWADAAAYRWSNRTVCAMEGEVRGNEMVMDVYEVLWESPPASAPEATEGHSRSGTS